MKVVQESLSTYPEGSESIDLLPPTFA